ECRRAIGLAHVARPLRMEVEAALRVGLLRLRGLVALVLRVELALEDVLGVGERVRIDGPALHVPHREALDRAGGTELVAGARHGGGIAMSHLVPPRSSVMPSSCAGASFCATISAGIGCVSACASFLVRSLPSFHPK